MYELHNQGIPLLLPINQIEMIRAIQLKTKLTHPIYKTLGVNIGKLKKTVTEEISRGISIGLFYKDIARNIRNRTNNLNIGRSKVIAQTEGHRVGQQASYDCLKRSVEAGADVLKQWDSSLDNKVRDTHRFLDGQIRELDEPFVNIYGEEAMFPSDFGIAREDVNCRCVMLHRARWALDEDELNTLKERAEFYGIDKVKDFEEFKSKYINIAEIVTEDNKKTAKAIARLELQKAKVDESYITKDLTEIALLSNVELSGLDYRLKNVDSLTRKVVRKAQKEDLPIRNASEQITDKIRYTYVLSEENFTKKYFEISNILKEKGYKIIRVKNTFKDGVTYKGINTLLEADKGVIFELQYHTDMSLKIKENELHKIYEKQRVLDKIKDKDKWDELEMLMIKVSERINNPENVEAIL